MAKGLRPPTIPLSPAAIGRLLSRMPVIIRSHEGSAVKISEVWGGGDKMGDLSTNYFTRH
jgi:hypothetical protein